MKKKLLPLFVLCYVNFHVVFSQEQMTPAKREHLLMDFGWRFAFGHAWDTKKDFNNGTSYFSYFAKASYGDGAAAKDFDDRSWRKINLPHDWAAELPFSSTASTSHGFKAMGRNFPGTSIGWYRKKFNIPSSDLGRKISIAFDGVFRNSIVWVNGFYLGTEPSGYNSFEYNISDYLNYGGENTIAVRADATMEEGWFYEGAGIYRHVWLNKTAPVHVITNGTFVTAKVNEQDADITAQVTLINETKENSFVSVQQQIKDAEGKIISGERINHIKLYPFKEKEVSTIINVNQPKLWSVETPYLYTLITTVFSGNEITDIYETKFGIRTIRFDANEGFFLNGKHLKIHGTNNHQDHAGVGAAMPDALISYRIDLLKKMGCNAYRCSHNPPTPELLEACDRMGMLVIDENRLMGVSTVHLNDIKQLILRDRNHPSIISWSIGNEEWGIEGNILGARIAATMQAFVKSIDTTRFVTAAISGGWREGISNVIDVMGVNYIGQINTDEQHQKFPEQRSWGTEEGSTKAARGVYEDDAKNHLIPAYDKKPNPAFYSIEDGWKHYAQRNYLAGMFIWTGFDYRGEPTPFGWPSTGSNCGMLDQCGFPKDNVYYLRSWWTDQPTLHVFPHWNWQAGKEVDVWVYSNCDEVELFLNKKSLGKKKMEINGHLEWKVQYVPGKLEAVGYKKGKRILTDAVQTTSEPVAVQLSSHTSSILANKEDIAVINVSVQDKNNLQVPVAADEITFSVQGPGKIIGVGNGSPASLEADQFIETIKTASIDQLKEKVIDNRINRVEVAAAYPDQDWKNAFTDDRDAAFGTKVKALVYRGSFVMPADFEQATITLFYNSIGKEQSIYINGKEIAANFSEGDQHGYVISKALLHAGSNTIAITATPLLKKQSWETVNMNPGLFQLIYPAPAWKRKLFNGLAQVIVQSTGEAGEIIVTATGKGLKQTSVKIISQAAPVRPAVPGK